MDLTRASTEALQQHAITRAQSLGHRLQSAADAGQPAAALQRQVAELASLFIFQVLQAMRRTVLRSDLLPQGFAHEFYLSLFDQEVAKRVAQRQELGLTTLLLRQLQDNTATHLSPKRSLDAITRYQQQMHHSSGFALPVAGRLTSSFGWRRDPLGTARQYHRGLDFAAPLGTPVYAAAAGRVTFSGTRPGYGKLVIIEHPQGFTTYYAHNEENLVRAGETVRQGQLIARTGRSGRATGPHLHFELHRQGQALDPVPFLRRRGSTLGTDKVSAVFSR